MVEIEASTHEELDVLMPNAAKGVNFFKKTDQVFHLPGFPCMDVYATVPVPPVYQVEGVDGGKLHFVY